jgi:hypothetical protein
LQLEERDVRCNNSASLRLLATAAAASSSFDLVFPSIEWCSDDSDASDDDDELQGTPAMRLGAASPTTAQPKKNGNSNIRISAFRAMQKMDGSTSHSLTGSCDKGTSCPSTTTVNKRRKFAIMDESPETAATTATDPREESPTRRARMLRSLAFPHSLMILGSCCSTPTDDEWATEQIRQQRPRTTELLFHHLVSDGSVASSGTGSGRTSPCEFDTATTTTNRATAARLHKKRIHSLAVLPSKKVPNECYY